MNKISDFKIAESIIMNMCKKYGVSFSDVTISFDDEIEAAKVYDRRAIELFKEFARTNFPKENYN